MGKNPGTVRTRYREAAWQTGVSELRSDSAAGQQPVFPPSEVKYNGKGRPKNKGREEVRFALNGRIEIERGRNGFDGIAFVVESRAGFRAPVKRSETNNCQSAVCLRCLITK